MLIELVREGAAQAPQRPLVIAGAQLTYDECVRRAERAAAGLVSSGINRFGSALGDPISSVIAAVASSAVASEACLYPPALDDAELERFAHRFGHDVVVTERALDRDGLRTVSLGELEQSAAREAPDAAGSVSAPVLILTTGTTGEPKGARHDWRRLAAAVRKPDSEPEGRWLLAYNLNQFAGIQVLVHVLASGATIVVPGSRRAPDVIDAIREHGVTHASATPTFWRLIAGQLDRRSAGLLPLAQITLGGEAAPQGLIDRLCELFPQARVSHVYAGTEFGSVVSVHDGRAGLPVSVLERSEDADVRFRIVDGELQIRSRVGMLGYHGADVGEESWRPTGDLVELRDDRIQFVGRRTEIINVGGAKVHPLPIEEVVCGVDGVQLAAVYGRPNAITGEIVAVDVVAAPGQDIGELEARIRSACEQLPAAGRPRRIRFVPELEVRGNKLLRRGAAAA